MEKSMDRAEESVEGLGKPQRGDVFDMTCDMIRGAEGSFCGASADEYAGLNSVYGRRVDHRVVEVSKKGQPAGVRA
jgi:hypothetical protein